MKPTKTILFFLATIFIPIKNVYSDYYYNEEIGKKIYTFSKDEINTLIKEGFFSEKYKIADFSNNYNRTNTRDSSWYFDLKESYWTKEKFKDSSETYIKLVISVKTSQPIQKIYDYPEIIGFTVLCTANDSKKYKIFNRTSNQLITLKETTELTNEANINYRNLIKNKNINKNPNTLFNDFFSDYFEYEYLVPLNILNLCLNADVFTSYHELRNELFILDFKENSSLYSF